MKKVILYCACIFFFCSFIIVSDNEPNEPDNEATIESITKIQNEPVFILPGFEMNSNALLYAKTYIKKNSWGLSNIQKRSERSLGIISTVFEKYDVPDELKYMAVVESNLNTGSVCNSTGATGIWQLMPTTALELGLNVSDENDDRLHVYKSSVAVAKYLKQLYAEFNDWLLVIAAYNSGPAKVNRAIRLAGSEDFWELQNYLPAESKNHVKKYLGVLYFFERGNKQSSQA